MSVLGGVNGEVFASRADDNSPTIKVLEEPHCETFVKILTLTS